MTFVFNKSFDIENWCIRDFVFWCYKQVKNFQSHSLRKIWQNNICPWSPRWKFMVIWEKSKFEKLHRLRDHPLIMSDDFWPPIPLTSGFFLGHPPLKSGSPLWGCPQPKNTTFKCKLQGWTLNKIFNVIPYSQIKTPKKFRISKS